MVARLKDTATRERLKKEITTDSKDWENIYLGSGGPSGILIGSVVNRELEGFRRLRTRLHDHPGGVRFLDDRPLRVRREGDEFPGSPVSAGGVLDEIDRVGRPHDGHTEIEIVDHESCRLTVELGGLADIDDMVAIGVAVFDTINREGFVKGVVVPPPGPGFNTVMESVPALAMSLAGILAVSRVLLTKLVFRFEPFTCTLAPLTKLLPLTVRVNAWPPALALVGEMLERPGTGLLTVNVREPLTPVPGVATVIDNNPLEARSFAVSVAANWVLLTKVVLRLAPFT